LTQVSALMFLLPKVSPKANKAYLILG